MDLIEATSSGDVGGVSASRFDTKLSRPSLDCLVLWFVSTTDKSDGLANCCVVDCVVVGWRDTSLVVEGSEGVMTPWLRIFLCFGLRCIKDR